MAGYTHRERVMTALNHEEPDRIPLDLMGNATMLLDNNYFRLRDHLGLEPIAPVRSGTTANYYDERILEYFDIDFRRVFLSLHPTSWTKALAGNSSICPRTPNISTTCIALNSPIRLRPPPMAPAT